MVFSVLLIFFPTRWFTWIILVGGIFVTIDAILRGWFVNLLLNVIIVLAVITGLILLIEFWWVVVLTGLITLVVTMIRENLREL